MAVTSFHEQTGKWLTKIDRDTASGECVTLSIAHPLLCSQFTTYKLGDAITRNDRSEPLFDLDEALIEWAGGWHRLDDLRAIRKDFDIREFTKNGYRYKRTAMGDFSCVWEQKCA